MKFKSKFLMLFLTISIISCKIIAQETVLKDSVFDFSTIKQFRETKQKGQIINDYNHLFNLKQVKELSAILYNYNLKTTREIVVATVDNITPYSDIVKYATDLGNYWGVGDSEKNNGIVIVVCNPCRQIGIAVGSGTQTVLTSEICKEVIEKIMLPEFKNAKFYKGVKKGIEELIEKWE